MTRVKKAAKVVCGNGGVNLSDIGGAGYVKTSFGLAEAARVAGDLTIENSNGAVRAADVKGGANVRTSFAPVSLDGVEGPVRDVGPDRVQCIRYWPPRPRSQPV